MTQTLIYASLALILGFVLAWIIHLFQLSKIRRSQNSLSGFLESEKLIKERFQKENSRLHELKEAAQTEYELKILEYESKIEGLKKVIRRMDEDIMLLQKDNEETQELLHATQPVVHALKIKLLDANNTIARYKAQVIVK